MSVAAAIFHVFHHRLLFNLLAPDLGEELFSAYVEILNQCIVPTDRILADANSKWFAQPFARRTGSVGRCAKPAPRSSKHWALTCQNGTGARFTLYT